MPDALHMTHDISIFFGGGILCICATIPTRQEIQCLPYAGFLVVWTKKGAFIPRQIYSFADFKTGLDLESFNCLFPKFQFQPYTNRYGAIKFQKQMKVKDLINCVHREAPGYTRCANKRFLKPPKIKKNKYSQAYKLQFMLGVNIINSLLSICAPS